METLKCIYCNQPLSDNEQKEHIILDSLGGKRQSRKIVCSKHNNEFGNTIDKSLPESIVFNRCSMEIPKWDPPPKVLAVGTESGDQYIVYAGGRRELLVNVEEELSEKGKEKIKRIIVHGSFERSQKIVEGYKKSSKYKAIKLGEVNVTRIREPISPLDLPDIGGPDQYRLVAKLAFNYLGLLYVTEKTAISPHTDTFNDIRNFILTGDTPPNRRWISGLDSRGIFSLKPCSTPLFNRITVFLSYKSRNIYAAVEILGSFKFSVLLADNYEGESKAFSIVNYPHEAGPDQEIEYHQFHPLETSTLLDGGIDEEWLEAVEIQLSKLYQLTMDYDIKQFRRRAIVETFESMGIKPGESVRPEQEMEFSKILTEKIISGEIEKGVISRKTYAAWDEFISEDPKQEID